MPKVSVIIPVYNCEIYIEKCIESLMKQTCMDFEILLMVGISQDKSLIKCLEWQKKDRRIIIVSREDAGLGDARNYALKIARGKYVAYLDADDFYEADYIEKMSAPLDADDTIDISCCGYDQYNGKNVMPGKLPAKEGQVILDFKKYIDCVPAPAVWMKMFRRQWLIEKEIEMFDGCCEDQALHFVLAAQVKKIYFIRQPLYHYNIGNEKSLVKTLKSRLDYAPAIEYAIEYLKRKNLYEENCSGLINSICSTYNSFLQETNYNKELVKICENFMRNYFPEIVEEYEQYKEKGKQIKGKIILYGAGIRAEKFLRKRGSRGIAYIVDNNSALQGTQKYGLTIEPVENLYNETDEITVVVTISKYYYEIVKELRKNHLFNIYTLEEFERG